MNQDTSKSAPAFELRAMTPELAEVLGPAIAAIDPWAALEFPALGITDFLTNDDPAVQRLAVMVGDDIAGAIAVRRPWLRGPYLQLLALLTPYQGCGLGAKLLDWFEKQAIGGDRWLWLCCSTFNTRAYEFYQRHGFEKTAVLPDLIVEGDDEILMRKCVIRD